MRLKQKIVLGIEYDGSNYYGWQQQKKNITIQSCLEQALSKVANTSIKVSCAGRTDAGVHALGQVVHFETNVKRIYSSWSLGVNSYLPKDITIRWVSNISQNFHARFSAIARKYQYIIDNYPFRPALFQKRVTHFYHHLNEISMNSAAQILIGEHDFSSFRSIQCQSRTPWRKIKYIKVIRKGQYIIINIKANSFLHHMVRNIVGSLIEIGCGNKDDKWLFKLLKFKNRNMAAKTAPARGLYLVSVDYPNYFNLPKTSLKSILIN